MADVKISALTSMTNAELDGADLVPVVDTSAVETKQITVAELDSRYGGGGSKTTLPVAFTPTVSAGTCTFEDVKGIWRQNGNYMHLEVSFGVLVAGGSGSLTVSIPSGSFTIDTTYILETSPEAAASFLGDGKWFDNGSAYRHAMAIYSTTTTFVFAYAEGASLINASFMAAGDKFSLRMNVPILEFVGDVDV